MFGHGLFAHRRNAYRRRHFFDRSVQRRESKERDDEPGYRKSRRTVHEEGIGLAPRPVAYADFCGVTRLPFLRENTCNAIFMSRSFSPCHSEWHAVGRPLAGC